MTEEEKRQFTNRLNALSDAIDELNYKLGKKTGRGSNDIKGALIKSVNFVSGSAGWQLTPDGDFEASSGTFRGSLIGGTITGGTIQTATADQRIVMTSAGMDFFNTAGTLIASLLATSFTKFLDITSPSAAPFDGIFITQAGAGKSGITIVCADSGAGSEGMFIQNDGDSSAMRILSKSTSAGIGLEIIYQGTASEALKVTSSDTGIVTVGKFVQSGGPGYAVEALGGDDSAREALFASKDSATVAVGRFNQTVATSTNFFKVLRLDGGNNRNEIWMSDGASPNGNLSGRQGDLCMNGPGGQPFYNNNGSTGWTAM